MEYGKQHTDGSRSGGQPPERAPKLLTEAEWRERLIAFGCGTKCDALLAFLHERGLIADEPVDPDLLVAREICARVCEGWTDITADRARQYRNGSHDDEADIAYALAALKRGKELRLTLTREMVEAAWSDTIRSLACGEFSLPGVTGTMVVGVNFDAMRERLHAALMEQMQ